MSTTEKEADDRTTDREQNDERAHRGGDDETPACLYTEQHVDADVFEVLWCLFCGNQSFVETRYDGVHCAGCGASVRVQRWNSKVVAIFGGHTPEFVPHDGELRQPPETPVFVEIEEEDEGHRIVTIDAGGEWEPKPPSECVDENEDGPTTPYMRWDDAYTSDEAGADTKDKRTEGT